MDIYSGASYGQAGGEGVERREPAGDPGALVSKLVPPADRTGHRPGAGLGLEVGGCGEGCDLAITMVTALLPSNSFIFLTDVFVVKTNVLVVVCQGHRRGSRGNGLRLQGGDRLLGSFRRGHRSV